MNELENLSIKAGPDLIKHVKEDIDDIVTKEAKVDNRVDSYLSGGFGPRNL